MPEDNKTNNDELKNDQPSDADFQKLLDADNAKIPQAGEIIKGVDQVLFDNTQDIQDGDTIIIINLPRLWKGAQFTPNGYVGYLQGVYHRKHLNLVYVEKDPTAIDPVWLRNLQQAYAHHYYVFIWNNSQQILEPLRE